MKKTLSHKANGKKRKKKEKSYRTIYQKSVQRTLNDYNPTRDDEHRRRASSTTNSSFDESGDRWEIDRKLMRNRKREKGKSGR